MDSQFLQEDALGNSVKSLTKVQADNSHRLSYTREVMWSWEIGLIKQDLPFMNPCWLGLITLLSFMCLVNSLKMNHSIILPSIEVRLIHL